MTNPMTNPMTNQITPIDASDGLGYELRIDAPPEIVWRFWVEPAQMVRWMGTIATLEPRPGGAFRIDYGQGDVVAGEYLDLDAPRRLTLRWAWESSDPVEGAPSRIEVELDAIEGGQATMLRLRHLELTEASRTGHDEGWRYFLPRLTDAISSKAVAQGA
jgi:uncharacterized protein YndB with AHSA1/START domain